ncbi:MAG: SPOR domain-containing protein [Giesbergeria sp.]|nr:SPOR domain-containing protein [Giesbergeria sp.]
MRCISTPLVFFCVLATPENPELTAIEATYAMPPPSPLTNSAIAETLGLPPQASSSAMIALYSAALGPVQLPRYLALFERFDRASRDGRIERAPLGWNLAASLLTLDWMALHALWKAALVYGALVYGLALVMLGIARPLLNMPPSVEYGLLGALALFSIALPGLFGDALLHAQTRQRIGRAIAAEPNLPGACALLEKQASSQRRLLRIAAIHAALLTLLAVVLFIFAPSRWSAAKAPASPSAETSALLPQKPALPAVAAPADPAALPGLLRPTPAPELSAEPPALAPAPVPEPAAAPEVSAAAPLPVPVPAPALAPAAAPAAALVPAPPPPMPAPSKQPQPQPKFVEEPVVNPVDKAAAQAAAKAAEKTTKAGKTPTATKKAADKASAKLRKKTTKVAPAPEPTPAPTLAKKTPVAAPTAPSTPAGASASTSTSTSTSTSEPLPVVGTAAGHYLNVGAFGEVGNARRAQAKLLNAGFPAFRQSATSPKGEIIRVRVGPYQSAAEAQKAAQQIRRMGLEAVAFRQRGQ